MLMFTVYDVVAHPTFGTALKGGEPLKWPSGYTGRRAGAEVEVLDPEGNVVLKTGGRYKVSPREVDGEFVACGAIPCPECELGSYGPL